MTAWGYIFGAAIYHDADSGTEIYLTERDRERQDAAKEMAEQAIRTFLRDPDLAVSLIHDPGDTLFRDGELYTMIVHLNGTIVAHGDEPRLVGTDIDTLEDTLGANLGDIFEENDSAYGRWADYYWPDPRAVSDDGELTLAWIKASGDHMFAVGVYPEDPDTDRDDAPSHHDASRKDAAREMTQTAIRMFGQDPERAASLIHDGDNRLFHDAELYPIVADQSGIVVAHGNAPHAAGTHISDVEYGSGTTLDAVFRAGSPIRQLGGAQGHAPRVRRKYAAEDAGYVQRGLHVRGGHISAISDGPLSGSDAAGAGEPEGRPAHGGGGRRVVFRRSGVHNICHPLAVRRTLPGQGAVCRRHKPERHRGGARIQF